MEQEIELLETKVAAFGQSQTDSKANLDAMADAIHKQIVAGLAELQDLRLEFDGDQEKLRNLDVREGVYIELRTRLRKIKLEIKAKVDVIAKKQREEIFRGNTRNNEAENRRKNMQAVEAAKLSGAELTEAMKQASQIMAAEVERSVAAVQALESQTKLLEKTKSQYSVLQSVLGLSSNILRDIHRGSLMDKFVLYGGLAFFLITVFYIVWKRMWIPGLSVFRSKYDISSTSTTAAFRDPATRTFKTSISKMTNSVLNHLHHDHEYDEL